MGEQPVLSISLLASNRRETIRKCLDSLSGIMEKVPSELIIVDTGCDGETRGILEEYTRQIINFEWCNDFARARNAGLSQARGKWFMYIDDDEWFTDVTEIVNFFVSCEYRKYGAACYIQRNFMDREGISYTDDWVGRMVCLTKDTRFIGCIHEYLSPSLGDCKLLHSPANHFGYLFDSNEKMYKRVKRNTTLLLKMLGQEKEKPRWWTHLAQEYGSIHEYYKLYDLCKEAIGYFEKADSDMVNSGRGTFYVGCIYANLQRGFYEDAIKDYQEAIQDKRNTEACQAALYVNAAAAYIHAGQYEEAAVCSRKYLRLYRKLKKDENTVLLQGSFFVRDALQTGYRNNACSYLIISELKQMHNQALKKYFGSLGWEDKVLYPHFELIPEILGFWSKTKYEECYVQMADILMGRKDVANVTVEQLKEKELEEADFMRLARIFSQVSSTHYYISYLHILYGDFCGNIENLSGDFEKMFEVLADFFGLPDKFWGIAGRGNVDLGNLLLRIPFDRFKMAVDSFAENSDKETIEKRRKMMAELKIQEDIRYDYFTIRTTEALTANVQDCDSYETLHEKLLEYVDSQLKFHERFFNDNAFMGEMEMLPLPCRLAIRLGEALLVEQEGDRKVVLERYRDCLGIFPPMNDVISKYAHLYKEKTDERGKLNCELENLGREMKQRIRFLMEQGMISEAEEALCRLKEFIPEDKELEILSHEMEIH